MTKLIKTEEEIAIANIPQGWVRLTEGVVEKGDKIWNWFEEKWIDAIQSYAVGNSASKYVTVIREGK